MEKEKIAAGINLLRRLPPSKIERNSQAISSLIPDLAEDFLSKIDKPLELGKDTENGNDYIQSEFNRDGDSFRSHWSNKYNPQIQDATYPSSHARELEVASNTMFQEYLKLYYQGGVCSVYFWDKEDGQLACAVLIKKSVDHKQQIEQGQWDSVNVIDIKLESQKKKVTYLITSTVILEMAIKNDKGGDINISGSMTKAKELTCNIENEKQLDDFHLQKIGQLVEEMEGILRTSLDSIYVGKTKESIFTIRSLDGSLELEKLKKGLVGLTHQDKQEVK